MLRVFVLNAAFAMEILDLIFPCTSRTIYHATQTADIFHILQLFLICNNLYWGWLPWDILYLSFFFTFISIPQHLPVSISLSIMPCSTASSLASSTVSFKFHSANYLSYSEPPQTYRQPTPVVTRSKVWGYGRSLGLRVRIPPAVRVSVFCECCHEQVSSSGWSLVQRSPTEGGVSVRNREASIMRRPWPTRGCRAMTKPPTLRHSLCKLNRIGDKQHLCLTPLPRLHTSCLPLGQLYSNTLIHVKKGITAVTNEPQLICTWNFLWKPIT